MKRQSKLCDGLTIAGGLGSQAPIVMSELAINANEHVKLTLGIHNIEGPADEEGSAGEFIFGANAIVSLTGRNCLR